MTELDMRNFDVEEDEFDEVEHREFLAKTFGEGQRPKFVNSDFGIWGNNCMAGCLMWRNKKDCNTFSGWRGCLGKHTAGVVIDDAGGKAFLRPVFQGVVTDGERWGEDAGGKAFVRPVFHHCGNWGCSLCYEAQVYREADKAAFRISEAEKLFGLKFEHVIVSVPLNLYHKAMYDMDSLKRRAVEVARMRGVESGCIMAHAFRQERINGVKTGFWFPSPHFHIIGNIAGGYRCRNCPHNRVMGGDGACGDCRGFERLTRDFFKIDGGWIVKIAEDWETHRPEERMSILRTLRYQLSHATFRMDRKRAVVLSWFGRLSYRRLKIKYVKDKRACPLCGEEEVRLQYTGNIVFCLDKDSPDFIGLDGILVDAEGWTVLVSKWDSGGYGGDFYDGE
jgi:hypothetical protein